MTAIYRCVQCGHTLLTRSVTAFTCAPCGSCYPIVFNVPLFLPRFRCMPSGFHVHGDTAAALCELVGAEASIVFNYVLQQIHSYDYEFAKSTMEARNNRLLRRAMKRDWGPLADARGTENGAGPNGKVVKEIKHRRRLGMRILEIGATTIASVFPQETYCVDTDVHALQIIQSARHVNNGDPHFIVADVSALPFVERSFDVVVCTSTIANAFHASNGDSLHRLLKAGGIVTLTDGSAMAAAA